MHQAFTNTSTDGPFYQHCDAQVNAKKGRDSAGSGNPDRQLKQFELGSGATRPPGLLVYLPTSIRRSCCRPRPKPPKFIQKATPTFRRCGSSGSSIRATTNGSSERARSRLSEARGVSLGP